jgi:hypothetical protein
VVRERQAVEVDESVAHGVHESVRCRLPSGVPDAALVEPRRCGHPVVRVSAAREGGHQKAEEEERVDGGGKQSGGQVERLHCWLLGFLELPGSFWQKKIHRSRYCILVSFLILFFLRFGENELQMVKALL